MPITVVATLKAKPESVDAVRDACKQAIEAVHTEPGCDLYSLHEADVLLDVPPHAATMKVATTARPRRREKLPKFIPFDSLPESEPGAGWHTQVRQGQYCGPADDVARTEFACAVDFS